MIHRNIEKSLHLLRVQIHRQHAIDARGGEKIRHQFRGDRHARLIFAILPRVTKKRNHRRDPLRARPPRRVHHDEQLHQVLVGRRAGRLNDENIAAANVLLDLDVSLAVGKRADRRLRRAARRCSRKFVCASSRLAEPVKIFSSGWTANMQRKGRYLRRGRWAWQKESPAPAPHFSSSAEGRAELVLLLFAILLQTPHLDGQLLFQALRSSSRFPLCPALADLPLRKSSFSAIRAL